jgi:hypothetical protein
MKFEIMFALEVPQLRINAMVNFDPEQLSKILHSHNLDHRHKNMLIDQPSMYQHTNFHNPNTESPCPFPQNCRRGEPVRKGQRSPFVPLCTVGGQEI